MAWKETPRLFAFLLLALVSGVVEAATPPDYDTPAAAQAACQNDLSAVLAAHPGDQAIPGACADSGWKAAGNDQAGNVIYRTTYVCAYGRPGDYNGCGYSFSPPHNNGSPEYYAYYVYCPAGTKWDGTTDWYRNTCVKPPPPPPTPGLGPCDCGIMAGG